MGIKAETVQGTGPAWVARPRLRGWGGGPGQTSRTPPPGAAPVPPDRSLPFPARTRGGVSVGTSVLPSLSAPTSLIPVQNGAGARRSPAVASAPLGSNTRAGRVFSARKKNQTKNKTKHGDCTVVPAWGQKPWPVTSPKPRCADPQGLRPPPPPAFPPAPDKGTRDPARPGRAPSSARRRPSPPGPALVPRGSQAPSPRYPRAGSSPAHRPHPGAPRSRRAQPRRGLAGGLAWSSAP